MDQGVGRAKGRTDLQCESMAKLAKSMHMQGRAIPS